ncbi:MAG: hypothetical protein U1E23_17080 [Reyranellaceae bacterium]
MAALLMAGGIAHGQTPPARPAWQPGLADLMLMTVQPRHLKLGLGGQERNWDYAAFAVHELEETLEHVGVLVPTWRGHDIAASIKGTTAAPIEAVEKAIKAKDGKAFDAAFAQLTASCNACHHSAGMGVVVIQVPKASPYANQDFRPAKP